MASFTFGGGAEHGCDVVIAFDIGLRRKIKVTAIGLRFAGEGVFRFCSVFEPLSDIANSSIFFFPEQAAPR